MLSQARWVLPSPSKPGLLDRTGGANRKILHHRVSGHLSPWGYPTHQGALWQGLGGTGQGKGVVDPCPSAAQLAWEGVTHELVRVVKGLGLRQPQGPQGPAHPGRGRACQAAACLGGHWGYGHPSRGDVGCSGTYRRTPTCLADKRGSSQGPQTLTTREPQSGDEARLPRAAGPGAPSAGPPLPVLTYTSSYPNRPCNPQVLPE